VNGLPPEMSKQQFETAFNDILQNVTGVFRFGVSREVTESTFHVSFKTNHDAWNAINQTNYGEVNGQEIRVTHFIDSESMKTIEAWNFSVSGIHSSLSSIELHSTFSEYGAIFALCRKPDPRDRDRIICRLQFYEEDHARLAITRIPIDHDGLEVLTSKEYGIVVYNFAPTITRAGVMAVFPNAVTVKIEPPKQRGYRPVVWIGFTCREDQEAALVEGDQQFSDGLRLFCFKQTMEKSQTFDAVKMKGMSYQSQYTIYIKSLPQNTTQEDVVQKSKGYGRINSCVVLHPNPGKPYAIVAFEDQNGFERAKARPRQYGAGVQVQDYRVPAKPQATPRRTAGS
jgi:hypothetical protein